MKQLISKVLATGLFLLLSFATIIAQNQTIELTFVDHLMAGFIEQDVFVEKVKGTGFVYRITVEEREKYLDAELFTTKEAQKHNPFSKAEIGPYQKGQSLGITLKDWLSAKGTASYTCDNGWGVLKAEFSNLIPNATYTMWHAFMAKGETNPFVGIFDLPLGDRDGSQSIFRTDENGKASLNIRFETCLQLTETQLMSLLAIALHSDGKTYGVSPGPFGKASHVQLFTPLPESKDVGNTITGGK